MNEDKLLQEMKAAVNNDTAKLLTLEVAKSLKGKRIQTIYFGYDGQDGVDDFTVGEITDEYTLAKSEIMSNGKTRAEHLGVDFSKEASKRLHLLRDDGTKTHILCLLNYPFPEGYVFTCSDSDRAVFFVEA